MFVLSAGNGIIKNERVAQAMLSVDRANFCKQNPYTDSPQGIGYAVTISAPHMVSYLNTLFVQSQPSIGTTVLGVFELLCL